MPIRLRNGLVRYPRVAALAALVMVALGGTALRAQALFEKTDLFVGGQDDYNTFRGPTLLCTKKGTVLAFAEGKHDGAVDGAGSDLVLKRSLGNDRKWTPPYLSPKGEGRTRRNTMMWLPQQVVIGSTHGEAYMNMVALIDQSDGTIYVLMNPYFPPYQDVPADIWLLKSTDEGATWSKPVDVTPGTGRKRLSPGVGIQLKSGRLMVAAYDDVIFSDDHGKTWKSGGTTGVEQSESQIVELADGSIMFNRRGQPSRTVVISNDKGLTWTDARLDPNLPDSDCQGTLIRYTRQDEGYSKNRLLFANPVSGAIAAGSVESDPRGRFNMTVRLSYDEGQTWPVAKEILEGPGAYSSMTVLPDGSIAIAFETGEIYGSYADHYGKLVFARFNVEWLTDGRDHLEKSDSAINR